LGKSYTLDKIEALVSFTSFKNITTVAGLDFKAEIEKNMYERDMSFFRKGQIGDWYNYFTEDMSRRVDEALAANLKTVIQFNYGEKPVDEQC
jgi:hypothetical protein